MTDKVYIDGKVVFETGAAGEALRFAQREASSSGIEAIVSLDGGAYGYRIGFLYEDDLSDAIKGA